MEFETKFSQAHHCKKELCFSLLYMCIVMKAEVIHFIIQKNQAFSIIVNKTFLKYRTSLWYRNDCLATTTTTIVIIIIINNQSDVWVQNNYKISCIKEIVSENNKNRNNHQSQRLDKGEKNKSTCNLATYSFISCNSKCPRD